MTKTKPAAKKVAELHEDAASGASASTLPKEPSFAVTERKETNLTDPSAYAADASGGMENVGNEEQVVPFYRILQALSPAIADNLIPGAVAGQIINVATQQRWDSKEGVVFIPAVREHNFAKFTPRDKGGGFEGLYLPDDPVVLDCQRRADRLWKEGKRPNDHRFGKLPTGDDKELIETYYLFGHFLDQSEDEPMPSRGVIAYASSQIKVYKQMITLLNGLRYNNNGQLIPYPLWSHRWRMKTVSVKGKKGTYYAWQPSMLNETPIASRLPANHPVYLLGREMYTSWRDGKLNAQYNQMSSDDVDAAESGDGSESDGPQPEM